MELRQYLDILKRHKWFIIEAIVVVGLAAGIVSSLRTPVYKATARVLLTPNDPTQVLNPTNGNGVVGTDPDRYVAGQVSIAESEAVAAEAVKSLPGVTMLALEGMVAVSQSGQSNVLNISATDTDPAQARNIADAVAKGYIENRRSVAVSGLQGAADDIEAKLGPLQTHIAEYDIMIGEGSTVAGATSGLVSPATPGTNAGPSQPASQVTPPATTRGGAPTTQEALKAARYAAAVQYETLYSRQQELLVDISLKRGDAELIAQAKTPAAPVSPKPRRDAALGAFAGLLIGVGVTFLREQLNDKVRSAEEVERLTGLPLLAQLPYDEEASGDRTSVAVVDRPSGALSEAIRSLRTSIEYLGVDRPLKIILVTSPAPGEGKSLVAVNLAAAFARADYRTLLISADLRRASINSVFGDHAMSAGLTTLLAPIRARAVVASGNGSSHNGKDDLEISTRMTEALVKTDVPNLLLLPSGPTPPNPAELLGSRRMAVILDHYSSVTDVIVIDTSPLLPVTDASVLAAKSDGVVLVTALNQTRRDATERSQKMLEGTGARVLGLVVNKSPKSGSGYYYSYYGDSSGEGGLPPASPGKKKRKSITTTGLSK